MGSLFSGADNAPLNAPYRVSKWAGLRCCAERRLAGRAVTPPPSANGRRGNRPANRGDDEMER